MVTHTLMGVACLTPRQTHRRICPDARPRDHPWFGKCHCLFFESPTFTQRGNTLYPNPFIFILHIRIFISRPQGHSEAGSEQTSFWAERPKTQKRWLKLVNRIPIRWLHHDVAQRWQRQMEKPPSTWPSCHVAQLQRRVTQRPEPVGTHPRSVLRPRRVSRHTTQLLPRTPERPQLRSSQLSPPRC